MITVKVTFADGDTLTTSINTDIDGARNYYVGKIFNLGSDDDRLMTAVSVEEITNFQGLDKGREGRRS